MSALVVSWGSICLSLHASVLCTFPAAGGGVLAGDTLRIVLHTAHLGYDSMSRRAHDSTVRPVMRKEIRGVAEKCEACQLQKPWNKNFNFNVILMILM